MNNKHFVLLTIVTCFASCGFQVTTNELSNSKLLSKVFGSVPSLIGSISHHSQNSFYAYAAGCEAHVELFELNDNDQVIYPAIARAPVMPDGSFSFEAESNTINNSQVKHILEVSTTGDCDELLQRPLTNPGNPQVVTPFSTLVSFARESDLSKKLTEVSKEEMEKLLSGTSTIVTADEAFNILSTSKAQDFSLIFSDAPNKLAEATPVIKEKNLPAKMINEGGVFNYKISAYHWDPSYKVATQWKLDGEHVSSQMGWSYTPDGKSSGPKNLEVFIGADNGSGLVDLTKPYHYLTHSFVINNNILPHPPALDFAPAVVATRDITINMLTGPGMINCQSFNSLAVTIDDAEVPLFFMIDCEMANIQPLNLTLPAGDGPKTVRLWARDHEGIVSALPSQLTLTLDQTGPLITTTSPMGNFRGGQSITSPINVTDPHGITNLNLHYSTDNGASYIHHSSISSSTGYYSWTLPAINSTQVRIKIIAQDSLGNISTKESDTFSIDSSAPIAPGISLVSPPITNNVSTNINIASCGDYAGIIFNESPSQPTSEDSSWQSCQSNHTYTLSDGTNGIKTIYAFSKDAVGNISSASSITLTLDTIRPDANFLTLQSASPTNNSTISFQSSNCTEMTHILISNSSTAPQLNDAQWVSCASGASTEINGPTGNYDFYAFAKDAAGNISTPKLINIDYDISPPTLTKVIINPSTLDPEIGDEYTGTVFVNVKVTYEEETPESSIKLSLADPATGECVEDNSNWTPSSEIGSITKNLGFQINSGDGTKKICAWVKDYLGNISTHVNGIGTDGIDMDTIKFEVGNIPQITALNAQNTSNGNLIAELNEDVSVFFNVTDVEGLHNNPLTFEYSLNNTNWYILNDINGNPLVNYGNLSDNPTVFNGSLTIKSPSSSYFRIRLKAVDKAGNDSLISYAAPLNTHPWLIYAGSTDSGLGNSALATSFSGQPNYGYSTFAFDPIRGDLYVKDSGVGIIKIDIKTSKSSLFLKSGFTTMSLPSSGNVDANLHVLSSYYSFDFSPDGWMYINAQISTSTSSSKLYRLNPETMEIQYLAGGGTDYSDLTNPAVLNVLYGVLAVDESGSSYVVLHCSSSGSPDTTTSSYKLVKINLQNEVTHVAGNCTRASSFPSGSGPYTATSSSLGSIPYQQMGDIAVKDNGNIITYQFHTIPYITKIINGQMYRSSFSGIGMKFAPNGKLILTNGDVKLINIDSSSSNLDTIDSTIVGSDYTKPSCHSDGLSVSSACAVSQFRAGLTKNGQIMFADGPVINGPRKIRIRYVNEENKIVTFAGTQSVFGEGADKSQLRGSIGSIYYQPSSLASADFPEGLYIGAPEAPAIYHINTSGTLTRFIGSGIGAGSSITGGAIIDSSFNLGAVYTAGHSGANFNFGSDGYPYIRGSTSFFKVGAGKIGINKMAGNTSWDNILDGGSALSGNIPAVTLKNNIAIKDDGIFIAGVGVYNVAGTSGNNSSSLRYMNFAQDKVVHIMGGNGTNAYSPDQITDTDLRSLNLNMTYSNTGGQFVQYDKANDILYFVENSKKLRYITAPGSHQSKLITIIDYSSNSKTISNFTLRPDGTSLFFVSGGKLYCHNLNGAPAWCDGVTELGPGPGLPSIGAQPNQFSWKNNSVLYISNGSVVMSYTVP